MTYEQKVKRLWPNAKVEKGNWGAYVPRFRVTIKPGRYTFGRQARWAWSEAWFSITQDMELHNGDPSITGPEVAAHIPREDQ